MYFSLLLIAGMSRTTPDINIKYWVKRKETVVLTSSLLLFLCGLFRVLIDVFPSLGPARLLQRPGLHQLPEVSAVLEGAWICKIFKVSGYVLLMDFLNEIYLYFLYILIASFSTKWSILTRYKFCHDSSVSVISDFSFFADYYIVAWCSSFICWLFSKKYFKGKLPHFRYPMCLYFLDLLQYENFRKEIVNGQCCKFIDDQTVLHWQHYSRKRMKLLETGANQQGSQTPVSQSTAATGNPTPTTLPSSLINGHGQIQKVWGHVKESRVEDNLFLCLPPKNWKIKKAAEINSSRWPPSPTRWGTESF